MSLKSFSRRMGVDFGKNLNEEKNSSLSQQNFGIWRRSEKTDFSKFS